MRFAACEMSVSAAMSVSHVHLGLLPPTQSRFFIGHLESVGTRHILCDNYEIAILIVLFSLIGPWAFHDPSKGYVY